MSTSDNKTAVIGARNFISAGDGFKTRLVDPTDLIWICTSSDLQVKILEVLEPLKETKVIIEKPICSDSSINESLREIFLNRQNIFISRPWNFSPIWMNFKSQIQQTDKLEKIIVKHFGESARSYLNPPQDWLHHDLCLIQDLGLEFQEVNASKTWGKDFCTLRIQYTKNIRFDISGGYKQSRESSFILEDKGKLKFEMNLGQGVYSILKSNGERKLQKVNNTYSLKNMLKFFEGIQVNKKNHEIELKYMEILQILATD